MCPDVLFKTYSSPSDECGKTLSWTVISGLTGTSAAIFSTSSAPLHCVNIICDKMLIWYIGMTRTNLNVSMVCRIVFWCLGCKSKWPTLAQQWKLQLSWLRCCLVAGQSLSYELGRFIWWENFKRHDKQQRCTDFKHSPWHIFISLITENKSLRHLFNLDESPQKKPYVFVPWCFKKKKKSTVRFQLHTRNIDSHLRGLIFEFNRGRESSVLCNTSWKKKHFPIHEEVLRDLNKCQPINETDKPALKRVKKH